ncbi:polynucleotide adenylyltransferase PcnB [Oligoflexia bacterium]|nr:polynucleotide adenylyltransferase PcnB [Oligoflexia bacterium]
MCGEENNLEAIEDSTNLSNAGSGQTQPAIYSRDQHCISRANIDPDALKIIYRLTRHGHSAFLVGGGVRDLLLNKRPKDFDIATSATPRQIKSLFRNCRIIGRRFKLAHIYFKNHKIIETATFRDFSDPIDLEQDSEKDSLMITRDNTYGTEATDALRRDITINALFYDAVTFSIIDYVGGFEDHKAKIVRMIGEPDVRFAEDPVRLMRVVRYAVRSGFNIEDKCLQSILKNHEIIAQSSSMRLYEEFKKDLQSGHFLNILRSLNDTALLQHLLPELAASDGSIMLEHHDFAHCLARVDSFNLAHEEVSVTAVLALVALFLNNPDYTLKDLPTRFVSRGELIEYLNSCFVKLAVPRKERERIEGALMLWHRLENEPFEKIKVKSLESRKHLDDLYWLLRFLSENESTDELLKLVTEAHAKKKMADQKEQRTRRKRKKRPWQRHGNNQRYKNN